MTKRIPVLDPTGKVKEWLDSNRGINVWENVDLSSHSVGQLAFTPGDKGKPSWRYSLKETVNDVTRFIFYKRANVVKRFSSTPQGFKAAWRFVETQDPTPRDTPIGKVYCAYSVEDVFYETPERVTYPLAPNESAPQTRPLDCLYFAGVVQWQAIDESTET